MRIALISDIHGNDIAFSAVLDDIRNQGVDSIVSLGDITTLGPQPVETMERLRDLNCVCIMGNHDASLLQPEKALDYKIGAPLFPTLEWCLAKLNMEHFEFVRQFQDTHRVLLGGDDEMLCYHGSPKSNVDNIFPETSTEEVEGFLTGHNAKIMASGHTHIQMLRPFNGMLLINPGSIGNVFLAPFIPNSQPTLLPWAEYAIIDWRNGQISVEFKRIDYDINLLFQTIDKTDIPLKAWLLTQFKWPIES